MSQLSSFRPIRDFLFLFNLSAFFGFCTQVWKGGAGDGVASLVVFGGETITSTGQAAYLNDVWLYTPDTGDWREVCMCVYVCACVVVVVVFLGLVVFLTSFILSRRNGALLPLRRARGHEKVQGVYCYDITPTGKPTKNLGGDLVIR